MTICIGTALRTARKLHGATTRLPRYRWESQRIPEYLCSFETIESAESFNKYCLNRGLATSYAKINEGKIIVSE
jgi:hypothetical protein